MQSIDSAVAKEMSRNCVFVYDRAKVRTIQATTDTHSQPPVLRLLYDTLFDTDLSIGLGRLSRWETVTY
jgi:hypothetical protein